MTIVRIFTRSVDRLSVLILWSMAMLVLPMALALFYEVVSRYWFNAPTLWAQDIAIFFFAYIGVLGGAGVMRENGHIRVDIVYSRLPPRTRAVLDAFTLLLVLFFLSAAAWMNWEDAWEAIAQDRRRSTEWGPPLGHLILAISIGAGLLWLQTFANWLRAVIHAVTGRQLEVAPGRNST